MSYSPVKILIDIWLYY